MATKGGKVVAVLNMKGGVGNGVPSTGYDDTVENELRAHLKFGPLILGNRLRRSKLLEASADYTGFATEKGVAYSVTLKGDIGDITDELSTRWDL